MTLTGVVGVAGQQLGIRLAAGDEDKSRRRATSQPGTGRRYRVLAALAVGRQPCC